MLISSRFRRDLTVHEEAAALFAASEAGMSRAEIRRATGLRPSEVRAGITAGALSPKTRELTQAGCYEWTLDDLALLAPFEDDPDALGRILQAVEYGQPLAYIVQKAEDERQDRAYREQLTADLQARGVTVMDHPPAGATSLDLLRPDPEPGHDDNLESDGHGTSPDDDSDSTGTADPGTAGEDAARDEMDPAVHASCPGAVAVLRPWQHEPAWYCLDPDKYGHARRQQAALPPARTGGEDASAGDAGASPEPDPGRKLVIEGNKAWDAAGKVRHRWLAEFLARKAPPTGSGTLVPQFVAAQILTMPAPLRQALGGIRNTGTYQRLSGPAAEDAAGAAAPRLWMLALAPIAAAYEDQMTGTAVARSTWRTDRHSSCPRADAGTWLSFLAQAGYPLSPIEQAVADGIPYHGDAPGVGLAAAADDPGGTGPQPGSSPADDAVHVSQQDSPGEAGQDATAPLAA